MQSIGSLCRISRKLLRWTVLWTNKGSCRFRSPNVAMQWLALRSSYSGDPTFGSRPKFEYLNRDFRRTPQSLQANSEIYLKICYDLLMSQLNLVYIIKSVYPTPILTLSFCLRQSLVNRLMS